MNNKKQHEVEYDDEDEEDEQEQDDQNEQEDQDDQDEAEDQGHDFNGDEDEEEQDDYPVSKNYNNEKFKKFTEIANKKGDPVAKTMNNNHYDIVYEMNESVENEIGNLQKKEENSAKSKEMGISYAHNVDKLKYEDEEEEEEENFEYMAKDREADSNNLQPAFHSSKYNKLPQFDFNEFKNLSVNPEVKDLLSIMTRFQPNEYMLDAKLKPYIPSYIPTIGEVDAFIKMNRPDNLSEELGFTVLDEPTICGIDPSIFSLELSYKLKSKVPSNFIIKSIENAEKNPLKIQNWIEQVTNLHKDKMSSSVSYTKQMPDIESLMQIWPEKMESTFKEINFPNENLNMSIENYAMIVCNMMDIPIHNLNSKKAIIEALHVLFTLYSEFKENQHFQRDGSKKGEDNVQSMKFY